MAKNILSRAADSAAATTMLSGLLLCLTIFPAAEAVWFDIPRDTGSKCVSEELQANVVVLGSYYLVGEANSEYSGIPVIAKVTSPFGNTLHDNKNVSHGEFAFTSKEAGTYYACFTTENKIPEGTKVTMNVDWKIGIAAKDWNVVAKKEHIEGVELQVTKLKGIVNEIHFNIFGLIHKERAMLEVNDKTNKGIAWYGMTSLGVCTLTSVLQIWRLKRYFVKKRLI